MRIEVNYKNRGILNSLKFQLADGNIVEVICSGSSNAPGRFIGRGVVFSGSDSVHHDEKALRKLGYCILKVTAAEILDNGTISDADLISIAIYGGNNEDELLYYLSDSAMEKFQKITVDMDGYQETMTMEKYNKIAKFVRRKDRLDTLQNAAACELNEKYYDNVVKFLEKETAVSPDVIASDWSEIEAYSGEDEQEVLNSIIKKRGGMAWYNLISNKCTDTECMNTVLLMCQDAERWMENIRERDNGALMLLDEGDIILTDENGDKVDLFFVDEIIYLDRKHLC